MTGVILRNAIGYTFTGRIDDLTTSQTTKAAVIKLPGIDKDVVQKMGASNKTFSLKGYVTVRDPLTITSSESSVTFLNNAVNYTGSVYFHSDALAMDLIPVTVVLLTNLQWKDAGNRPMERTFTLDLVEIK